MSIGRENGTICIVGDAAVDEAETLAAMLAETPHAPVDWSRSGSLHTAVFQVLLVLRPRMIGTPRDAFVARWLAPLFNHRR